MTIWRWAALALCSVLVGCSSGQTGASPAPTHAKTAVPSATNSPTSSPSAEPLVCAQAALVRQGPDRATDVLALAAQTADARVLDLTAQLARMATGATRTIDGVCLLERRGEPPPKDVTACDIGKDLAGSGTRLVIDIGRAAGASRLISFTDEQRLTAAVALVDEAISTASTVLIVGYCSDPIPGTR